MDLKDVVVLMLLFFLYCVAFFCGAGHQKRRCNIEAVAAGVAHWTVDAEGQIKFEYNK